MDLEKWLNHYMMDCELSRMDYSHLKYKDLPEVTLSAPTGTGQMASIPVLNQQSYSGRKPVIPSALADTLCADLSISGLLEKFNTALGTSYTQLTGGVCSALKDCILKKYDFGTAYARLRLFWNHFKFKKKLATIVDELSDREVQHQKMLQDVLVKDRILYFRVPPRRVWDLCSNRVVSWSIARQEGRQCLWGISHAWMDEEDREDVLTSINGYEWPVPIPKGISLDLIRIEMLNLGAEYVWLDVLCLRQKGGIREDLREEEWKVDVPTIGNVYGKAEKVVNYLSGLGRPLSSNADDFGNDRCWFKRAWTLQEITEHPIIGGDTGDVELQAKFEEKLTSLQHTTLGLYEVLSEMQKRVSTNPMDKVAGMTYPLGSMSIPAYYEEQSEEDAWIALVNATGRESQGNLLFMYPEPGNGNRFWRPSWNQVMSEKLPTEYPFIYFSDPHARIGIDSHYHAYSIESAFVRGLSKRDSQGQKRQGELVVKDCTGTEWVFKIVARHQYPIPDGSYTLLGDISFDNSTLCWVVGWRLSDQRLKKLSVFEMYEEDMKAEARMESLVSWGIATEAYNTFLA
ncbi:hypothetical protein EV421DRAFT_2021134 [Armillaria borealis]|uniref:Heterokaryon incompatibility domain-containing protein n=1 Tax=Armillaria borealis TaxID=47425 RepID=A0AA39MM61_9AGAR|nr:hypothetical protein EV421DRAFT_2021134 [Armillaria borealis]